MPQAKPIFKKLTLVFIDPVDGSEIELQADVKRLESVDIDFVHSFSTQDFMTKHDARITVVFVVPEVEIGVNTHESGLGNLLGAGHEKQMDTTTTTVRPESPEQE